jgi:hypothetical protein
MENIFFDRKPNLVLYTAFKKVASVDQLRDAWYEGRDFRAYQKGWYCSIRDTIALKKDYNVYFMIAPAQAGETPVTVSLESVEKNDYQKT